MVTRSVSDLVYQAVGGLFAGTQGGFAGDTVLVVAAELPRTIEGFETLPKAHPLGHAARRLSFSAAIRRSAQSGITPFPGRAKAAARAGAAHRHRRSDSIGPFLFL